jgi:hypothetical protein
MGIAGTNSGSSQVNAGEEGEEGPGGGGEATNESGGGDQSSTHSKLKLLAG